MLIAQITDAHVGPPGHIFYGRVDTAAALASAVAALNRLEPQPDIVLFTGDLADVGTDEEYAHISALLEPLAAPLAVIPGNHDARAPLRRAFAANPWLPAGVGPLNQVIEDFPLRLIGLDTLDTTVPGPDGRFDAGRLDAGTLEWLETTLSRARDRATVIFMHHPPFATGIGHMDAIGCRNGDALGAIVARHPQIERVLCGHVHRGVVMRWAGTVASICPSVAHQVALDLRQGAPAAFVTETPAMQLHLWKPGAGLISHTLPIGPVSAAIRYDTGAPL